MDMQALMRCEGCLNVWATRIVYDEKLGEYKEEETLCPVCRGTEVKVIAESV